METHSCDGIAILKKSLFSFVFSFFSLILTAQVLEESSSIPSAVADIPKVIKPSPTVAGFMKFEEVPINNYTGMPNISIPLFATGSHSKDININLSLSYHPSSIAPNEEAGYVGLGWSLIGGGTISRSVRGLPDEYPEGDKSGIYASPYYHAMAEINMSNKETLRDFIYDSEKYDSQHDLYQFNFMGHSGRFYITQECDGVACFKIKKIDNDNAIDIQFNNNFTNPVFTVYDDKGYKYIFDVVEMSSSYGNSKLIYGDNSSNTIFDPTQNFFSALHLSKIYDRNAGPLAEPLVVFHYSQPGQCKEISYNPTVTSSRVNGNTYQAFIKFCRDQCSSVNVAPLMVPMEIYANNTVTVDTRKLELIDVKDHAKIYFTNTSGRLDNKQLTTTKKLSGILVKNYQNDVIKNIQLEQDYSTIRYAGQSDPAKWQKRLMLRKVYEIAGNDTLTYKLDYAKRPDSLDILKKDYWGYVTGTTLGYNGSYRQSSNVYSKIDALQKMTLPTGGSIIYGWESNTYSYVGDTALTDFADNPLNWIATQENIIGGAALGYHSLPNFDVDIYANFNVIKQILGVFKLQQYINGQWVDQLQGFGEYLHGDHTLLAGESYRIAWTGGACPGCPFEGGPNGGNDGNGLPNGSGGNWNGGGSGNSGTTSEGLMLATYRYRNNPEKKYLFGGGIRIGKIAYFDNSRVSQLYYEDPLSSWDQKPVKEKLYNYNFFNDTLRSSGSLAFPKPVFEYPQTKTFRFLCPPEDDETGLLREHIYSVSYDTTTDFNNYSSLTSHGTYVGYQNVQVSETGNGFTRYTYTNAIDYPEENYYIAYPFAPTPNVDYKRGLLRFEKIYNEAGVVLNETENKYDFDQGYAVTGLRVYTNGGCIFRSVLPTAQDHDSRLSDCQTNPMDTFCQHCPLPVLTYITHDPIREAYGWAKLIETTNKSHFYEQGQLRTVSTKTNYEYNPYNKKIESEKTYLPGEIIRREYAYTTLPNNQISSLLNVKTFNNQTFTGFEGVDYGTTGNFSSRPKAGRKSKFDETGNSAEVVTEIYEYDTFGNPIRMSTGPAMAGYQTIIWGYNNTLPIAIIEGGSTFDNFLNDPDIAQIIASAKQESNVNGPNLLGAYYALRSSLPDKMVTTYIYKPLVGVLQATDPKGTHTYYEYDVFNRLIKVKDHEGKIISENKYHYKPAN